MHNLTLLTQSHSAIAAKKTAKRQQIKEVIFDDNARREFLTGFHKRKVAKTEAAKKKALERQKQEKLAARREQRRQLRERATENAVEVESAYQALLGPANDGNAENEEEWCGRPYEDKGKRKEDEFEDEEIVATVTVVEDIDPVCFSATLPIRDGSSPSFPEPNSTGRDRAPAKVKPKPKKIRYETKEERRRERVKQTARRAEKAEIAGGKASRSTGVMKKRRTGHKH